MTAAAGLGWTEILSLPFIIGFGLAALYVLSKPRRPRLMRQRKRHYK